MGEDSRQAGSMDPVPVSRSISAWLKANLLVACALLVMGCVYVGQAWSPSSYGHVLQVAGASNTGLIWGQSRPIRSDEWSVTTPLTQAAVRNHFERYNQTSFYGEDLRSNYSLPLHDWGLAFKPTYWLYGVTPAAFAFSWHYWAMFVVFLFGYAHLFKLAGASPSQAFLFSGSLYFTGFVQFFWNSNTSLLAYFPWLMVAMASSWRLRVRALIFYWVATCWLIGNFYPPLFISLALVAAVVLWAYRPDLMKGQSVLVFGLATLAACGTAVIYLWDYLAQTAITSYPGQRTSVAGYYPWHLFLTHFWPSALFNHDFKASVTYTNVTGVGVAGFYWTAAAACFTHWTVAGLQQLWRDRTQRVLLLGLAIAMAWMLAPVPDWIGTITGLNRVPPERMVYAAGLLIVLNAWHASSRLGLVQGRWVQRSVLYISLSVAGWLAYGWWTQPESGPEQHLTELMAPLVVCCTLWLAFKRNWNASTALIGACALVHVLVFGRFNPIQSALPIFEEPRHELAQTLRHHVDDQGVLYVQREGLIGATLNGMGFKAVSHLNVTPQWPIWTEKLGALVEPSRATFNRYAHIRLIASDQVKLLENDQVGVPASFFRPQPTAEMTKTSPRTHSLDGGRIELLETSSDAWILKGWAHWTAPGNQRELLIVQNKDLPPLKINFVADQERWDRVASMQDANQLLSGFVLSVQRPENALDHPPRCVFSRSENGQAWQLLSAPWALESCSAYMKPGK